MFSGLRSRLARPQRKTRRGSTLRRPRLGMTFSRSISQTRVLPDSLVRDDPHSLLCRLFVRPIGKVKTQREADRPKRDQESQDDPNKCPKLERAAFRNCGRNDRTCRLRSRVVCSPESRQVSPRWWRRRCRSRKRKERGCRLPIPQRRRPNVVIWCKFAALVKFVELSAGYRAYLLPIPRNVPFRIFDRVHKSPQVCNHLGLHAEPGKARF